MLEMFVEKVSFGIELVEDKQTKQPIDIEKSTK